MYFRHAYLVAVITIRIFIMLGSKILLNRYTNLSIMQSNNLKSKVFIKEKLIFIILVKSYALIILKVKINLYGFVH